MCYALLEYAESMHAYIYEYRLVAFSSKAEIKYKYKVNVRMYVYVHVYSMLLNQYLMLSDGLTVFGESTRNIVYLRLERTASKAGLTFSRYFRLRTLTEKPTARKSVKFWFMNKINAARLPCCRTCMHSAL